MKKMEVIKALRNLDQQGVYILTKGDLAKLFPEEQEKTFEKSLQRLVKDGILQHVCKGVYLNPFANSKSAWIIEEIACVLRRGCFSYVSLESILSEYGVISQIPPRRITVMTSGPAGVVNTPYGTIEFTHTKRSPQAIIQRSMVMDKRPLRIATKAAAVQDLLRVGRNVEMMELAQDA
jgi:predicted transcriptional regulator of viral defense system